ncbi:hypothetical protein LCGC14_0823540 [marine sediment metagenome]|uniref:Uncharacterized protein n=1 Tax=marine sediment metagenome TaxID=412755 RepID=A0A0F9S2Y3_9ZZZZ
MNEVTSHTTIDLLNEVEKLKAKLSETVQLTTRLERRLAEAVGAPEAALACRHPRYAGYATRAAEDLTLPRHPRPGKVTLYIGRVPHDQPSSEHDLVLWQPACTQGPHVQAAVADQCLGLAVTHGLSVGVVSVSDHLFDRLRLRTAQCRECLPYVDVLYFDVDYYGQISTHTINLNDRSQLDWPQGFGLLGVNTEIAIGCVAKLEREKTPNE